MATAFRRTKATKVPKRGQSASTVKTAKTLDEPQLARLLAHIAKTSTFPERDRLMMLLSFRAGLRAAEIAAIDIDALTDAAGEVGYKIIVSPGIAKKRAGRDVPMHPEIADAVRAFRRAVPGATRIAVSSRDRVTPLRAATLTVYLRNMFVEAGFKNCSSHSGRRTFGTTLARQANMLNRSLRDVQLLMGHARLDTTERYIDVAIDNFALVKSLGQPL